ncbi:MAG: transposase [Treponema sp.]|jgi:hypothetical protein|nr:transposase [Treponema sp.]
MASPAKRRRVGIREKVDGALKGACEDMEKRYEIKFLEIGEEGARAHFLIQSAPAWMRAKIVRALKSIIAKKTFERRLEVKRQL